MNHQQISTSQHFFYTQVCSYHIFICKLTHPLCLDYATLDVLWWPASVSHTICVQPTANATHVDTPDVPYPNAFKHAKEYLKKVL